MNVDLEDKWIEGLTITMKLPTLDLVLSSFKGQSDRKKNKADCDKRGRALKFLFL